MLYLFSNLLLLLSILTRNDDDDDENLLPSAMVFITLTPFMLVLGFLCEFKSWKALQESDTESMNFHGLGEKLRYIQYLATIASNNLCKSIDYSG